MKIIKVILGTLILSGISINSFAINLIDVSNQAYNNDPQFKAANAQWLAAKENFPISVAALLPQINAVGQVTRNYNAYEAASVRFSQQKFNINNNFYNSTAAYSLQLVQPIFNLGSWANVWSAQATVKQAEATYLSAFESLLIRTSKAYFTVLQANDILRFTEANKDAVRRQLEQTQHRYDVGLIAITDLENTKASYDKAIADEIVAKKNLADAIEQLAAITGSKYTSFHSLKDSFPLATPDPADTERWVRAAEMGNFDLAAAAFNSQAARTNITAKAAGHVPTLSGNLNYGYNYNNNNSGFNDFSRSKVATEGLTLNVPIFAGGGVVAQTRQAEFQYQQALSLQEQTHRSVVSSTRQAYLAVMAGISKVVADKQLVKSTESALRSTEAGYSVGTRTMVDVLTATSQYYDSQKALAIDEYDFLNQTLLLKQLAGILNFDDLSKINTWLIPPSATAAKATQIAATDPMAPSTTPAAPKHKATSKQHKKPTST